MTIKYKVKEKSGQKVLVEALIILFSWVNVIYCQDIWSSIIFVMLCIYQFTLSSRMMSMVWKTTFITFLIVYFCTLANLSSYNTQDMIPWPE
jgi:hypothetical protein